MDKSRYNLQNGKTIPLYEQNLTKMKMRKITIVFLTLAIFGLSGCGNNQLQQDVAPISNAMCKFIEIQNSLKAAREGGDSLNIHKFEAEKHKISIEMTVLNKEFQEKYGEKISDKEFGKKFKIEMNKAMIDCPHLSVEDRERMQTELDE